MYKDRNSRGGKLVAGPVWDYDLAFRNANYCQGSETTGWAYDFNKVCSQDFWQVPFWWQRLAEDEQFRSQLRCRWKQLRQTSLSNARVRFLIDSVYTLVAEAQQRHFTRWPILGNYVWPNPQPIASSYADERAYLNTWLEARLNWIDAHLPNEGTCYDYPANIKESVMIQGMPNPVNTQYQLTIRSRMAQNCTLMVTDAAGKKVYAETKALNAGYNNFTINMQYWPAGLYFVQIAAASGEEVVQKIVKH